MFELLTEKELGDKLAQIMRVGRHWIFVADYDGLERITRLEERHFTGPKAKAFDAFMTPLGFSVFTAKKSALSAAKLNKWLDANQAQPFGVDGKTSRADEDGKDILFLAEGANAVRISLAFHDWVKPYWDKWNKEDENGWKPIIPL